MADSNGGNGFIENFPVGFGRDFVRHYANRLTTDPSLAMIEIVSNCWDAGANRVDIQWPEEHGGIFSVSDDGIGMRYDEFLDRWKQLSYTRPDKGKLVTFPSGNTSSVRKVFGRNGKGRFSLFCFDDEYSIETAKDGEKRRFHVRKDTQGNSLFHVGVLSQEASSQHGTTISCKAIYNYLPKKKLVEVIGTKFIADPSFSVYVNGEMIELIDLEHLTEKQVVKIKNYGEVIVYELDSKKTARSSQQSGVAWWVNKKAVGKQAWNDPNRKAYLDRRKSIAKRFSYIVIADILEDVVEYDWTGFIESPKTDIVINAVNSHIQKRLNTLMYSDTRKRTERALRNERERLKNFSLPTRNRVREFANKIQHRIPKLGDEQLNQAVSLFTTMEEARLGYRLLEQLSRLDAGDVNALSEIMETWSVRDAQVVLEELHRRLKLIDELEKVVEVKSDELHVIHPLFEKGLWIFGPEYEDISYRSNASLATVIRELINDKKVKIDQPATRPDLVALADGQLQVFSANHFDSRGEVDGIGNVLIVELKRGKHSINFDNKTQAEKYARAILRSQKVLPNARIVVYVLGTTLGDVEHHYTAGDTTFILPRAYSTILSMARARTFHLKQAIEDARKGVSEETDVEDDMSPELKEGKL